MKIKNMHAVKSIIVNSRHTIKGGELTPDSKHGQEGMTYINPGDTVEIDDEVGTKIAEGYNDIMIVEKAKAKKKV